MASSFRVIAIVALGGSLACGGSLVDESAPPELLALSCPAGLLACNGGCLACSPPDHASPTCTQAGCGFACEAGYNQCSARSCVAEAPTSCGATCSDCTTNVPADADGICTSEHACDFQCRPGFLRSGSACVRAVALSSGFEHTCALTTDGRVKCWGSNEFGQLGNATALTSPIPVDPILPGKAQAIAAGYYHTCVVVSGEVYCWGEGTLGELGDGTMRSSAAPVRIPGLNGVDKVSAGGEGDPNFTDVHAHSCAIRSGVAWCWGSNGSGQLGDGTMTTRSTPVAVTVLPSSVAVTSIAIGERHTCALTDAGAVYCWGANDSGQLGLPGQMPQSYPAQPLISSGATSIAAGEAHTCAVVERKVRCWGLNTSYQIDPAAEPGSYPNGLEVNTIELPTMVTAGRYHTCTIGANATATGIHCFGSNSAEQLGSTDPAVKDNELELPDPNALVAISAGALHTCVLTHAGEVQCWGENDYGQLGNGKIGAGSGTAGFVSGR